MGITVAKTGSYFLHAIVVITAFPLSLLADVPAPDPRETEPQGTDWTFVLLGVIFSFLSALMFLWIGRKIFKRS